MNRKNAAEWLFEHVVIVIKLSPIIKFEILLWNKITSCRSLTEAPVFPFSLTSDNLKQTFV